MKLRVIIVQTINSMSGHVTLKTLKISDNYEMNQIIYMYILYETEINEN